MSAYSIKPAFRLLWNSDLMVLIRRLLIVYLMLGLCRIIFYAYNYEIIGPITTDEIWPLLRGAWVFDSVSIVYAFGLFTLLSLLPFRFRERKWYGKMLFWYFAIMITVTIALNLSDTVYFHYADIRFTAADLLFAENDNTTSLVGQFALENWHLVLAWIALSGFSIWLYRHSGRPVTPIQNKLAYFAFNFMILLAGAVTLMAMVRGGGLSRDLRPVTLGNATSYTSSAAKGNMILSNPFCILRTLGSKGIRYTEYFTEEELSKIFTPYHYPAEYSDSTAITLSGGLTSEGSKRNVVIFVLESFSSEHSALLNPDLYPNSNGYTPFLDSLMQEGYYFTRAYANGRKSVAALPAVLASMPSFKKPFAIMPEALGEGMQLPKILSMNGYNTLFFCGSPDGSMGFDAYANIAGVKSMYDKDDYDKRYPGNKDFDNYWGIWDKPFLNYMGTILTETKQPFFSVVFTLTSHHPFVVPAEYADKLPAGITKVQRPVAYTDMAIRSFFETYKDAPWFRNTLFIFTADHVSSERFAPKTETPVGKHHIMTFFYTPDGELQGKDQHVFQQIDIMPTTLGLLGYKDPYFAFGRDIFREHDRVPAAYGYDTNFQIIGDSITLAFDETETVAAYSASDTLMQHNIMSNDDPAQQQIKRLQEGVIQQYYSHLKTKQYTVPETK